MTYSFIRDNMPHKASFDSLSRHLDDIASHLDALGSTGFAVTVPVMTEAAKTMVLACLQSSLDSAIPKLHDDILLPWLKQAGDKINNTSRKRDRDKLIEDEADRFTAKITPFLMNQIPKPELDGSALNAFQERAAKRVTLDDFNDLVESEPDPHEADLALPRVVSSDADMAVAT